MQSWLHIQISGFPLEEHTEHFSHHSQPCRRTQMGPTVENVLPGSVPGILCIIRGSPIFTQQNCIKLKLFPYKVLKFFNFRFICYMMQFHRFLDLISPLPTLHTTISPLSLQWRSPSKIVLSSSLCYLSISWQFHMDNGSKGTIINVIL